MATISYKGRRWKADVLKTASLSSGFNVYLFKRYLDKCSVMPFINGEFVVAVKSPDGTTLHWDSFVILNKAIDYYTGYLCCYA